MKEKIKRFTLFHHDILVAPKNERPFAIQILVISELSI